MITHICGGKQFKMTFNINQVAINFQYNLADIAQFSTKTLEDYSIVSRKRLEKIIHSSERGLTEDEHRWLIKRDCKKVISDIKKYTRRRKSKNVLQGGKEGIKDVQIPAICAIQQYVLNNRTFHTNIMPINNILNINSAIRPVVDEENSFNVIVQNNWTVINVQQFNININKNNDNNNEPLIHESDDIGSVEEKCSPHVFIMDLERIYWDKWREYIKKKMTKRMNRCEQIDTFLLKIQAKLNADQLNNSKKRKASNRNIILPKPMKTAYDRQLAKIDEQKKLLEKQQKEIENLKLRQLKLESEKAMLENQKLFDETYNRSEKQLKIKNAPRKVTSIVKASPSDILNRMELRALDRQAKWEAIKEKRRKMEQEELRKKQELEEKCLKQHMEQKRKKLFEARENLRLKRIEECKLKMEREMWQENIRIADAFNRTFLLRKGLDAFRLNLKNAEKRMQIASNYYGNKILGVCFNKWRFFTNNNSNEKIFLAEQFYKRKLMKTTFLCFFMALEESKRKEQVAEDWHNFKIQEVWFERWLNYVRKINIETQKKMLKAEFYNNRTIIKYCFNNWRKFPEILYNERLKDCRLRMWHEKVQEILPDFIPPEL